MQRMLIQEEQKRMVALREEQARRLKEKQELEFRARVEREFREQAEAEARIKIEEEERIEAERIAAEEKASLEKKAEEERIAAEKKRKEDEERERLEREKEAARKKAEEERIALEQKAALEKKAEEERIAAQKKADDEKKAAEEKAEQERVASERKKAEEERIAREKKAEIERIEMEKAARKKAEEEERIVAENKRKQEEEQKRSEEQEAARLKAAEEERIASEEKAEKERIAAEKAAKDKAEEARIASEKKLAEEQKAAKEKQIAENKEIEERAAAAEKLVEERKKAEAAERAVFEAQVRVEADKERQAQETRAVEAKEIQVTEKAATEKEAAEKATAEKVGSEAVALTEISVSGVKDESVSVVEPVGDSEGSKLMEGKEMTAKEDAGQTEALANLAGSAKQNNKLQMLRKLEARNSVTFTRKFVDIDSDSEEEPSDEEFLGRQSGRSLPESDDKDMLPQDEEPKVEVSDDTDKGKQEDEREEQGEVAFEDLIAANPLDGKKKIRIKLKTFEESSSEEDDGTGGQVIASGESRRSKREAVSAAPKSRLLGKSAPATGTLSAPPGGARRRKPVATAAAIFDPTANSAATVVPAAAGFGDEPFVASFPPANEAQNDSFSAVFPPTNAFGSNAFAPDDSATVAAADSFPAEFPPSDGNVPAAESAFTAPPADGANDSFATAFPAAFDANFDPSSEPAEPATEPSFVASFPASFPPPQSNGLEEQKVGSEVVQTPTSPRSAPTKSPRAPPPNMAAPPLPSANDTAWFVQSPSRIPVKALKQTFALSSGKSSNRFPGFPEEALFTNRRPISSALRPTEILGAAVQLFDVKTVRIFMQIGYNPDSPVEESHMCSVLPLHLAGKVWLGLRRVGKPDAEEVSLSWVHTLGKVERKAQIQELVAICKLLLLKGAMVTPDMIAVAQELRDDCNDPAYADLLANYPSQEDLAIALSLKSPSKSEEETNCRNHLAKTAEVMRHEHLKATDAKMRVDAEKDYQKKLKKLPRAVVKKHAENRIRPLLSPLLRTTEQLFVCSATFDVIGIMNFIRRKTSDVNAPIEAWDYDLCGRMTPLEVMCRYWVSSDEPEPRQVFVFQTEYERLLVTQADCIESLSELMAAGAQVTPKAKEIAANKPVLLQMLDEKRAPKGGGKKKEPGASESATLPRTSGAEKKRAGFTLGRKAKKDNNAGEEKPKKFGRKKNADTSATPATAAVAEEGSDDSEGSLGEAY